MFIANRLNNMNFIVPQFIEREPKIVGPFTFKQFIFIGIAGGFSIFFYFLLPFFLFLLAAVILMGGSLALAFLKIGGVSLPVAIKNFFFFLSKPKIYIWEKKFAPPKISGKTEKPREETAEESALKVAERSQLRRLSTFLETKGK